MIIGIGCDTVDHSLTEKLHWGTDLRLQARVFTKIELNICPTSSSQRIVFLSGRFAIKEAVLKCLGIGMIDGVCLKDVEAVNDESGRPFIRLSGQTKEIEAAKGITTWHLSLSHSETASIALVVAEKL